MINKKIKMMPSIRVLDKGESVSFPIEKMLSVKAICTSLSTTMGTVLKTAVNRVDKVIVVTRVK